MKDSIFMVLTYDDDCIGGAFNVQSKGGIRDGLAPAHRTMIAEHLSASPYNDIKFMAYSLMKAQQTQNCSQH